MDIKDKAYAEAFEAAFKIADLPFIYSEVSGPHVNSIGSSVKLFN